MLLEQPLRDVRIETALQQPTSESSDALPQPALVPEPVELFLSDQPHRTELYAQVVGRRKRFLAKKGSEDRTRYGTSQNASISYSNSAL